MADPPPPRKADDPIEDELDPASYAYWKANGYRGRPPWRRGSRRSYLVISVALAAVFVLAANGQRP
jgi:hypothetical protein